ncbi:hypothetical protein [Arcticibacterium luteifluviistationis]|nr:hypothetical protein [Arcticibacterium luteifluviistationis]
MKKNMMLLLMSLPILVNAQSIIWTGDGDGLSWSDVNNWNTFTLPKSTDDVLIAASDPAKDSVSMTLASVTIKSLEIDKNNYLRISAGTTFKIAFSTGTSCDLESGNLINRGDLLIEDAGTNGIVVGLGQSLQNLGFGLIQTDRVNEIGISNKGTFTVAQNAIVDLSTCHVEFINNEGFFQNNGTFKTHYYTNAQAFANTGTFLNKGLYYHDGSLSVLLVSGQGYVENQGEFSFVGTQVHSLQVVGNEAKFENSTTGIMNLNGLIEIKDGGTLVNKNYIKNSAATVISILGDSATMVNEDTLYIFETGYKSINLAQNSFFYNDGIILIDSLNAPFEQIINVDSSTFVNNGTLKMDLAHKSTALSIKKHGLFKNNGSFLISNLGHDSGSGVINYVYGIHIVSGKLEQTVNAELILDSLTSNTSYYYAIGNFDSLVNNGMILLKRIPKAIYNFGGYTENNGTLEFRKIKEKAYSDIAAALFINNGNLNVKNSSSESILIQIQGSFENNHKVKFTNTTSTNRSIWSTGNFYNDGLIELDESTEGEMAMTGGRFTNDSCGVLKSYVRFKVSFNVATPYDSAVNYGLIQNYHIDPFNNIHEMSDLINRGVFLNTSGSINFQGINSGYISRKLSGRISSGIAESPIFLAGSSPSFLETNFYYDSALSILAGTFSNNALTGIKENNGAFSLFFTTSHKPSCPLRTFELEWEEMEPCSSVATNTFTGTLSNDWFKDENWDLNYVPTNCSNVIIPAGKSVVVEQPFRAKANKIETVTGAVLEIQAGSILDAWNGF